MYVRRKILPGSMHAENNTFVKVCHKHKKGKSGEKNTSPFVLTDSKLANTPPGLTSQSIPPHFQWQYLGVLPPLVGGSLCSTSSTYYIHLVCVSESII